jgi:hypothetical protein
MALERIEYPHVVMREKTVELDVFSCHINCYKQMAMEEGYIALPHGLYRPTHYYFNPRRNIATIYFREIEDRKEWRRQ